MIQVSAAQTQRTFIFQEGDPGVRVKLLAALTTYCIPLGDKDF